MERNSVVGVMLGKQGGGGVVLCGVWDAELASDR